MEKTPRPPKESPRQPERIGIEMKGKIVIGGVEVKITHGIEVRGKLPNIGEILREVLERNRNLFEQLLEEMRSVLDEAKKRGIDLPGLPVTSDGLSIMSLLEPFKGYLEGAAESPQLSPESKNRIKNLLSMIEAIRRGSFTMLPQVLEEFDAHREKIEKMIKYLSTLIESFEKAPLQKEREEIFIREFEKPFEVRSGEKIVTPEGILSALKSGETQIGNLIILIAHKIQEKYEKIPPIFWEMIVKPVIAVTADNIQRLLRVDQSSIAARARRRKETPGKNLPPQEEGLTGGRSKEENPIT